MGPNLDDLEKAISNTKGRTPQEVLDAFLPQNKKVGNYTLEEVTYGHVLVLEHLNHPLVKNKNDGWTVSDLGVALFVLTRPSDVLHKAIKNDSFEDKLYEFLADIPANQYENFAKDIIFHYYGSMSNVVPMESKNKKAQKKTDSAGFLAAFRRFVGNISGRRTS